MKRVDIEELDFFPELYAAGPNAFVEPSYLETPPAFRVVPDRRPVTPSPCADLVQRMRVICRGQVYVTSTGNVRYIPKAGIARDPRCERAWEMLTAHCRPAAATSDQPMFVPAGPPPPLTPAARRAAKKAQAAVTKAKRALRRAQAARARLQAARPSLRARSLLRPGVLKREQKRAALAQRNARTAVVKAQRAVVHARRTYAKSTQKSGGKSVASRGR